MQPVPGASGFSKGRVLALLWTRAGGTFPSELLSLVLAILDAMAMSPVYRKGHRVTLVTSRVLVESFRGHAGAGNIRQRTAEGLDAVLGLLDAKAA